jgi:hypothetical protein
VSLYLQIAVGAELYLLDANHVLQIREGIGHDDESPRWQGAAVPIVDLCALFEATAARQASLILTVQAGGTPAALLVDRVEGLAEFGDAEFRALPPIGPLSGMIDAVAVRTSDQRLLMRVCGERVLAIATAVG